MRKIRYALAPASLSLLAAAVIAATPGTPPATAPAATAPAATATAPAADTTPAPATTAASTAPSADEIAAKAALTSFFTAMFKGDQATAFGLLYYSEPKNRVVAEAMFGEILAEQELHDAVAAAFADKANTFAVGLGKQEEDDMNKSLDKATVKLNEKKDGATVQVGVGPSFVMALKDGKWLVDFDKTQINNSPMPTDDVERLHKLADGYSRIAEDVKAKNLKSFEDVTKAVDALETAKPAKTADPEQPK